MRPQTVQDDVFDRLAITDGRDLISIFIPTHTRGREVHQGTIRLKNQLAGADDELERRGWSLHDRQERLDNGRDLLDDRDFWEHQDQGLAVYIGESGVDATLALSTSPSAQTMVLPVFQMRPLLPDLAALTATVLALTRGWVGLFSARGSILQPVDADLPASFEDVNWFVDREPQSQRHPVSAGTPGSGHGHEPRLRQDEDLDRFLRAVSDSVTDAFPSFPLVVLGDDELVNRFQAIHPAPVIKRERGGLSGSDLAAEVEKGFSEIRDRLAIEREASWIDEARAAIGTGRAEVAIEEALPAAIGGRVATVVIHHEAAPIWGRVDGTSLEVRAHREERVGDVDLLDRLVVEARSTGADLHAVGAEIEGHPFTTVLRY